MQALEIILRYNIPIRLSCDRKAFGHSSQDRRSAPTRLASQSRSSAYASGSLYGNRGDLQKVPSIPGPGPTLEADKTVAATWPGVRVEFAGMGRFSQSLSLHCDFGTAGEFAKICAAFAQFERARNQRD